MAKTAASLSEETEAEHPLSWVYYPRDLLSTLKLRVLERNEQEHLTFVVLRKSLLNEIQNHTDSKPY